MSFFRRTFFREFDTRQFEEFEIHLKAKFSSVQDRCLKVETEQETDMFENLQISLERLIYDIPWDRPDITSPMKLSADGRLLRASLDMIPSLRHNFVFIISECPHRIEDLLVLSGCDNSPASAIKSILPQRIFKEYTELKQIRLFWVDMNREVCFFRD